MGAALGLIGPLMSIGGSIFGMANGTPASHVPVYQPTGLPQADASFQGGVNQLTSSTVPQALQTQNFLYNNPGAPAAQAGANVAGGMGQAAGVQDFLQGGNLVNTGNSVVPYAYSALNAGFDPQQSVYNQQFQQNTDQTRALLEARGIDSTPYGAGVEAQSNLNFNNNWLMNTLARQTQGAATANSLFNTQNTDITSGSNLSGQAPGVYFGGASLPYNTNQTIGTNQFNALGTSQQLQQTPITDWQNYLGYGTQTGQLGLQQAQQGFNQSQVLGQNLGAGLQGLAKGWQQFAGSSPNTGWATNSWAQNNPGAPGSAYYGPVAA